MILNNYSEFQVNIFSNNRDIRLHLENSKSKKGHNVVKKFSHDDAADGYDSTSTFSSKTAELKMHLIIIEIYVFIFVS